MKIKKAVIPAAGLGTRVLPASKAIPKEMLPIVDKPAIQYIVEEAVAAGITDILIITNRGKGAIEDHFDHAFELEAGLKKKEGYCPCRIQKTEDYKCMCKEFREQIADPDFEGYCHCMLYYKEKDR